MQEIKVLIVDDSALVRQVFKTLLETDPEIKVIGTASDPYIAVQKIQKTKPDVITLDIEMPKMDGLTFLGKIMKQAPMPVVVISNQTVDSANIGLKALEVGAIDVMAKPNIGSSIQMEESRIMLIDKVRSAYFVGLRKKVRNPTNQTINYQAAVARKNPSNMVIAIGASTGGTDAIKQFLMALPGSMPPILIVQHMPEKFTASFANRLNENCALHVKEAEHGEPLLSDTVYIAPGNHHMTINNHGGVRKIAISQGELVNRHRPSVNVLFHSVATCIGKNAIGIIMTGMGDDGATGLRAMFEKGAFTIAQDEATSVVYGMPYKALLGGGVKCVCSLEEIASNVMKYIQEEVPERV